ncbi:MAG TPA: RidA family protein [Gammaproteobacteria bacterium]|jgi:reactive intermediate/imine deaminase|nr:RidA family protein [Gammaproteobacteria bacterium]
MKEKIHTRFAPDAIGTYSQAVKSGNTVYFSGQIPLDPANMTMVTGDMDAQAAQVFRNLQEVARAAGGSLDLIVKLSIFLTDLTHFPIVNEVMSQFFTEPYPARSTVQVSALPRGAQIEMEAIMVLPELSQQ